MAKIKESKQLEEAAVIETLDVAEQTEATEPGNEFAEASTDNKLVQNKLPDKVRTYLQRHPEMESVYIDKLGGAFPVGTPQVFVQDAVLYHNPYFTTT